LPSISTGRANHSATHGSAPRPNGVDGCARSDRGSPLMRRGSGRLKVWPSPGLHQAFTNRGEVAAWVTPRATEAAPPVGMSIIAHRWGGLATFVVDALATTSSIPRPGTLSPHGLPTSLPEVRSDDRRPMPRAIVETARST